MMKRKNRKPRSKTWQLTPEQEDISQQLEYIKKDYACAVVNFMKMLPKKHHQIAWYLACDLTYELVLELSSCDHDPSFIKQLHLKKKLRQKT